MCSSASATSASNAFRDGHRIPPVSRTRAQDADTSASPPRITFPQPPRLHPEDGERGAAEQDDREDVDQREEAEDDAERAVDGVEVREPRQIEPVPGGDQLEGDGAEKRRRPEIRQPKA